MGRLGDSTRWTRHHPGRRWWAAAATAFAAATALAALAVGVPAAARAGRAGVAGPVAISVLGAPDPVRGADNRNHLVYELRVANLTRFEVTIDSVQPLVGGRPLGARLQGSSLAAALVLDKKQAGTTTIAPGVGATIFMDVSLGAKTRLPRRLTHRIRLGYRDLTGSRPPARLAFAGAATVVDRAKPVEIDPPLYGSGWVAGVGCCALQDHRRALNPIDGQIYIAERFAIDFVRLDPQGRAFTGAKERLAGWAGFGAPVHAVANGRVVGARGGLPEQVPGSEPRGLAFEDYAGNYVVERIAPGRYALYAHLQPGLAVRRGQRVRTGQVIGWLGNSGNTDGPHLHFHVMSSPSPLASNGLPFTFNSFNGLGIITNEDAIFTGSSAPINHATLSGPHRHQLPLNDQLLDLGRGAGSG